MKIVICTRPNASTLISGVKFSASPEGMVSEPVEDAVADEFCSIEGYTALNEDGTAIPEQADPVVKPVPRKKMGK
jgi:hypothetical protein